MNVKVKTIATYARVVGYYSAVEFWNFGKKNEWKDRQFTNLKKVKP
jgi:anaerobic ribonucleoside-triphosphate reductase